jgi:hypothetical protein
LCPVNLRVGFFECKKPMVIVRRRILRIVTLYLLVST